MPRRRPKNKLYTDNTRPLYNRRTSRRKYRNAKGPLHKSTTYEKAKRTRLKYVARSLNTGVYNFVRYARPEAIVHSPLNGTGFAFDFKLSEVVNYQEFEKLFDSYRIMKVQLTFRPQIEGTEVNAMANTTLSNFLKPRIMMYRDLDNLGSSQSEEDVLQRQDALIKDATQRFSYSVVPQVSNEIYRSSIATGYATMYKLQFLDVAFADIPHFGIRGFIEATSGGANDGPQFNYQVDIQYWLQFRSVR